MPWSPTVQSAHGLGPKMTQRLGIHQTQDAAARLVTQIQVVTMALTRPRILLLQDSSQHSQSKSMELTRSSTFSILSTGPRQVYTMGQRLVSITTIVCTCRLLRRLIPVLTSNLTYLEVRSSMTSICHRAGAAVSLHFTQL